MDRARGRRRPCVARYDEQVQSSIGRVDILKGGDGVTTNNSGGFMNRVWLGLVAVSVSSATPAAAQIMSNPSQWYINNQIYSMRAFNDLVANSMHLKGAKKGARPNPANPGGTSP